MKTKELVKKLEQFDGVKVYHKDFISLSMNGIKVGTVGTIGQWLEIETNCPDKVAKALFEYYLTPLEEREEEKKYRFQLSDYFDSSDFMGMYLNLNTETSEYTFNDSTDGVNSYKTHFTQKEIDDMPFDTNFFIKEEVL